MIKALAILVIALLPLAASAQLKRQRYANWTEKYASLQILEGGAQNTMLMIGVGIEARFEKHSMINQVSYLQKSKNTPSVTNYSYGYSIGPDWDIPFEPRLDIKAGASLIQRDGGEKSITPSGAIKFRISTLRNSSMSLNLFLEAGSLGSNLGYYSTGISINFGGAE